MWELWNLAMVCLLLFVSLPAEAQRNAWIATWATSPQSLPPIRDNRCLTSKVRRCESVSGCPSEEPISACAFRTNMALRLC